MRYKADTNLYHGNEKIAEFFATMIGNVEVKHTRQVKRLREGRREIKDWKSDKK